MEIKKAKKENSEEILKLYKSLVKSSGCAWDEYYPNMQNIEEDIKRDALYMAVENNKIVGVASAFEDNELIDLNCWRKDIQNSYELARIGVLQEYQNRGVAKKIIQYIEKDLLEKNVQGIRFIVSKTNPNAIKLYNSLEYECCGETSMYGIEWFCYEKRLSYK